VPDDPSFSLIMGLAYFRMGERDKAMREFNRVLEFDPRNSVAFSCIGQLQAHNNRGEEAAQYYGRSVALLRMVRMRARKKQ